MPLSSTRSGSWDIGTQGRRRVYSTLVDAAGSCLSVHGICLTPTRRPHAVTRCCARTPRTTGSW
eukprot:8581629-Pyramimonas_sp.AAC.1